MCAGEGGHVVLHVRLGGTSWSDHKWLRWAWEFPCIERLPEVNTSLPTSCRWASLQQKIWTGTAAEQKYKLGYKRFQNLKHLNPNAGFEIVFNLEYVWTEVAVLSINRTGRKAPDMKLMAHLSMKQCEIIKATDLFYISLNEADSLPQIGLRREFTGSQLGCCQTLWESKHASIGLDL